MMRGGAQNFFSKFVRYWMQFDPKHVISFSVQVWCKCHLETQIGTMQETTAIYGKKIFFLVYFTFLFKHFGVFFPPVSLKCS